MAKEEKRLGQLIWVQLGLCEYSKQFLDLLKESELLIVNTPSHSIRLG